MKHLRLFFASPSSHWVALCAIGSLFFTPISASFQSIFVILTCVLALVEKNSRHKAWLLCRQSWFISALGLCLLSWVGSLWSSAEIKDIFTVIGKYSKLLYLPLFIIAFRDLKTRFIAIHAFLLAMLITCFISYLKKLGWCHYHGLDPAFVFRNHIMTGYMMTFAAYLSALYAIKTRGKMRVLYGVLVLLLSYQVLFISMGRTSYLTYLLLALLLFAQFLSWRKFLIALIAVGILSAGIYQTSDIMQQRAQEAIHDWKGFHQQTEKNTPVGFRLQFHQFAHQLFNRHPILGNGTSGFSDAFKKEQPVPAWGPTLFEPHSQYWLVAADWGIMGLLFFSGFFISLLIASWPRKETWPIALGLITSFLLGCFLDSLLLYAGTGYFFLILMALCLAGDVEPLPTRHIIGLIAGILKSVRRYQPGISGFEHKG